MLTPWKENYDQPRQHIQKQRHYLPTKVCRFKAMVFPVVMCGCESWTGKKAEHRRIDAFELWCWRRLLRVPWTAKRSNQSILKEISPGCSLEGLIRKLKLQYFGHLMQRADSFEKTLMLGNLGIQVPRCHPRNNRAHRSFQLSSVARSGPTLCDPVNHSTSGLPVHHQLPEFTQTHVH